MRQAAAGALGAAVLLSGCTASAPPPDPWSLPGVTATLEQSRDSAVRHAVQVVLTAGAAPLELRSLQLLGGGLVRAAPTPRTYVVPAGGRIAFPVPYGTALCEGRPAPVTVVAGTPAGERQVPVPGDTLLARLRADECAQAAVAGLATLRLERLRRQGEAVVGELVVRRAGGPGAVNRE